MIEAPCFSSLAGRYEFAKSTAQIGQQQRTIQNRNSMSSGGIEPPPPYFCTGHGNRACLP